LYYRFPYRCDNPEDVREICKFIENDLKNNAYFELSEHTNLFYIDIYKGKIDFIDRLQFELQERKYFKQNKIKETFRDPNKKCEERVERVDNTKKYDCYFAADEDKYKNYNDDFDNNNNIDMVNSMRLHKINKAYKNFTNNFTNNYTINFANNAKGKGLESISNLPVENLANLVSQVEFKEE